MNILFEVSLHSNGTRLLVEVREVNIEEIRTIAAQVIVLSSLAIGKHRGLSEASSTGICAEARNFIQRSTRGSAVRYPDALTTSGMVVGAAVRSVGTDAAGDEGSKGEDECRGRDGKRRCFKVREMAPFKTSKYSWWGVSSETS